MSWDETHWRYGDTNPVDAAVDSETVIELGDLLWQDVHDAKPACSFQGVLTISGIPPRSLFASKFLGVALHESRNGNTDPIKVAITGVFEFDCPSGTFELGDLISASENTELPSGDRLLNQQVAKVGAKDRAIGRVAKREPNLVTSVLVDIRSRVMGIGI